MSMKLWNAGGAIGFERGNVILVLFIYFLLIFWNGFYTFIISVLIVNCYIE